MTENSNDKNLNTSEVLQDTADAETSREVLSCDNCESVPDSANVCGSKSKNTKDNKSKTTKSKAKKSAKIAVRIVVLVVLFCAVLFAGVIVSDMLFSNNEEVAPEYVTITVSADNINLSSRGEVAIDSLGAALDEIFASGNEITVVLINDTDNPADPVLYNEVVDILALYGKTFDKMDVVSTTVATADEF